jgi:hypothetical protein
MAHAVPEKKHAVLGPSGWDTWGNCPGSVPLGADIPNESSRYAREGTAAHQLLEDCLVGGLDAEDLIGREYEVEGESFVVDMDMAEAVDAALNYIRDTVKPERGDVLMTEASVPLQFMTGEEGAEGTSDVLAIVDGGKTMIVMDYKHGQGVKVWASERRELIDGSQELPNPNGQMAMYALGRLHEIGFVYDEIETVKLVILQPRMEQIDEFEMPLAELQAFGQQVELAAAKVDMARLAFEQGEDIELNPTEKGCKFCKAKPRCPALRNMTSSALSIVSDAEDFDNLTLPKKASSVAVGGDTPAEKLAEFMRAIPMIEEACKSVRGEVERRLLAGQQVPGYYLGVGRAGNRRWVDEEHALRELTKNGRLKMSEATTAKIISPTQAEKLLKSRSVWSKIAPLIETPPGGPSVCKEGDKNPPYKLLTSEAEDFDNLEAADAKEALLDGDNSEPLYEKMQRIANGSADPAADAAKADLLGD